MKEASIRALNEHMLEVGEEKGLKKGIKKGIKKAKERIFLVNDLRKPFFLEPQRF